MGEGVEGLGRGEVGVGELGGEYHCAGYDIPVVMGSSLHARE